MLSQTHRVCFTLLHYHYVSTSLTMQIPTETLSQTHRVCFMLLCYRFVSTTLTAQIPTETLSQSHRLFIVLRFCAIVSLPLHLPHKFLRKRYRKATGFASCFCISTSLTMQIPAETLSQTKNKIRNSYYQSRWTDMSEYYSNLFLRKPFLLCLVICCF